MLREQDIKRRAEEFWKYKPLLQTVCVLKLYSCTAVSLSRLPETFVNSSILSTLM